MSEPISIAASIITIAGVVVKGVKHAKTFYRAAGELESVQDQLETLTSLLRDLDGHQADELSPVVGASLTRAKTALEKLDQLIKAKILPNVDRSSSARRRAWTRNKSKIYKAMDELQSCKSNLHAAISAKNLHSIGQSYDLSLNLEKQMGMIQQTLSKTYHAVLAQSSTLNIMSQSTPLQRGRLSIGYMSRSYIDSDIRDNRGLQIQQSFATPHCYPRSLDDNVQDTTCALEGPSFATARRSGVVPCVSPSTILERSSNFFPETLTTDPRLPTSFLIVTNALERCSSEHQKTNFYAVFYQRSPRVWCRLDIAVTLYRSSKYWAATKLARAECDTSEWSPGGMYSAVLPTSLFKSLRNFLSCLQDVKDKSTMNLSLTGEGDFEIQPSGPSSDTSCIVESSFDVYRETLISLDDLGCPRYFEDEVIEIDVYDGPFRFISWFRGQYVLETKVARSEPSDDMLYNIRVLHCLKGVQGIAELVGIVMDNATGKQLKSYLIKLPMARNSLQHKAGDSQVSWTRREKWAYQVVQCISRLHARGFVAGTILRIMDPVVIDSSDNVEFWGFVEHFQMGYTVGCYYPPEFRHLQTVSPMVNKADRCKATSKTDIYHLGLLLWLLAENVPRTTKSPACLRNRCDQETSKLCDASHWDPIALPPLPDCIPQYFKNIVNYCRTEKPEDRPAARDLLKLFPSRDEPVSSQTTTNCLEFTSTTTQGDAVGMRQGTSCECGRHELSSPIFHCFDCDGGDFDICVECFNKGEHCQDNTHYLVETTQVGSSMMPGRYYSAVKSSGSREVFEV